ncbi:MAG: carbohydrate kinase family protein [Oscillospiraceae bacterium]|jgi:sugar/nucleoside kinase (ribokinase family)
MPEKFGKAVVLGDACVDMTVPLPEFKKGRQGDDFIQPTLAGGGTCANTAVALSKLDVETAFMGTLGQDSFGRYLLDEFSTMGIDTEFVQIDPDSNTVCCFAFLDPYGEKHMWAWPKEKQSYARLDVGKIDLDKLKSASWLHSSGMNFYAGGPIREILPELFKTAYEAGVTTSFDLNTRVATPEALDPGIKEAVLKTLPYCTYILGSARDEFYSLFPCNDWKDSAGHFSTKNNTVIARSGADETWIRERGGSWYSVPSFKVKAVNTTGAGDVFNAGFVSGRLHGKSTAESVRWGAAAAAYKVARGGARETPDMSQLLKFMESFGEDA